MFKKSIIFALLVSAFSGSAFAITPDQDPIEILADSSRRITESYIRKDLKGKDGAAWNQYKKLAGAAKAMFLTIMSAGIARFGASCMLRSLDFSTRVLARRRVIKEEELLELQKGVDSVINPLFWSVAAGSAGWTLWRVYEAYQEHKDVKRLERELREIQEVQDQDQKASEEYGPVVFELQVQG